VQLFHALQLDLMAQVCVLKGLFSALPCIFIAFGGFWSGLLCFLGRWRFDEAQRKSLHKAGLAGFGGGAVWRADHMPA
jgi:hypothetical protein